MRYFFIILFLSFISFPQIEIFAAKDITLQVPLPGNITSVPSFAAYIMFMYKFLVGSIGLVAVVMIMVGGMEWILAAGNSQKIEGAKTTIFSAVAGLLIAISSFTILNIINPNLTSLKVAALPSVTGENIDYASIKACTEYGNITDVKFYDKYDIKVDIDKTMCRDVYTVKYKDSSGNLIEESCYGQVCTGGTCITELDSKNPAEFICLGPSMIACGTQERIDQFQGAFQCFGVDSVYEEKSQKLACVAFANTVCQEVEVIGCPIGAKQTSCKGCPMAENCVEPDEGVAVKDYKKLLTPEYELPPRVKGGSVCCIPEDKLKISCSSFKPTYGTGYLVPQSVQVDCGQYEGDGQWCGVDYDSGSDTIPSSCLKNPVDVLPNTNFICSPPGKCWAKAFPQS